MKYIMSSVILAILALLSTVAMAEPSYQLGDIDCLYSPWFNAPHKPKPLAISVEVSSTWKELTNKRTVSDLLNNIRQNVERHCKKVRKSLLINGVIRNHVAIRVVGYKDKHYATAIRATYTDGKWKIRNKVILWVEEERRRLAAEERRKHETSAKLQLHTKNIQDSRQLFNGFVARSNIIFWPDLSDVQANPFVFRNEVIGVFARFKAMIGEHEAIFTTKRMSSNLIDIVNVPTIRFKQAKALVLIAADVNGLKQVELSGTTYTVPSLKYLDAYQCKKNDCRTIMLWAMQQDKKLTDVASKGLKLAAERLLKIRNKMRTGRSNNTKAIPETSLQVATVKPQKNKKLQLKQSANKKKMNATSRSKWIVQVGLYASLPNAHKVMVNLRDRGFPVVSKSMKFQKEMVTQIWIGPYGMFTSAVRIRKKIVEITSYKNSFITTNPLLN